MAQLRGIKRDSWEGGHRIPFIASWPSVIQPGTTCDQTICLTDFTATSADIIGARTSGDTAEDSVSFLPLLEGQTGKPTREFTVHHSHQGKFAIRKGDWVYLETPTGDENSEPEWFKKERGYKSHNFPAELYNLRDDISERKNLYADYQEIVRELSQILRDIQSEHKPPQSTGDHSNDKYA